jgi:hypothetical protein
MNKSAGIVYLIIGIVSVVLGYDIYLQHQTQLVTAKYYRAVIAEHEKNEQFITEHIEDIYKLSVIDSVRGYVTMDTLIRVFHYAKPHKNPVGNCPECADIRRKGLPNKQLPGERPKLPQNITPERVANAIQGSRRHVENPKGYARSRSTGSQ